jgi:hypothetical protein
MKPTTGNENGCDPISSNCVIWQGPDLACIDLCKGDSVSAVVNKLATELCTLLDMFNIANYDTSCFNLAECSPKDFAGLITLIIEKVCAENNISNTTVAGCPDCEVAIKECFQTTNAAGDKITSMQLKDYVLAIGNQVCILAGSIGTINTTLSSHNTRISALEQAGVPTFTLPTITPSCVLPSVATSIDAVLVAVEKQFCDLRQFTGTTVNIGQAIQAACIGLNTANKLQGVGQMSSIPGWIVAPQNLAQSFSNLWKTVCDMRGAIQFIQANCCDTGCSAIDMQVIASLTTINNLRLDFVGSIPSLYVDANPSSTVVLIDSAGGTQTFNNVAVKNTYFDLSTPYNITLGTVNGALDVTVKVTLRLVDPATGGTCESVIQTIALGTETCPNLILVANYTGVSYSFTWNGTIPQIVTMQVYDSLGTTLIQSLPLSIISTNPSGNFTGLVEGTAYKIRIVINGVPCAFESFTSLTYPCVAPGLSATTESYATPQGSITGVTIDGWLEEYDFLNP